MNDYRFKSGMTYLRIQAPTREEAEASFKEDFKGREYQLLESFT